jgi:ABC-type nitrate/sulfonate/bicarbonate transport system permease component
MAATSTAPATGKGATEKGIIARSAWLPGAVGLIGLLVLWEVSARTLFAGNHAVASPTAIAAKLRVDGLGFYGPNIVTTVREASTGWLYGNVIAVALAIGFVQIPVAEQALMKVALASYCLPVIAIGPILAVFYSGDTPKVILAALSVTFTTLVSTLVGLRHVDPASLDLIRAYGGGRWAQLWKVRLRASLPSMFAGLRIAAPAAMLGAIVGEYLGAESGLGVAMINSQQSLAVERTWGIAVVATALSGLGYAATALVGRLLAPWAPKGPR